MTSKEENYLIRENQKLVYYLANRLGKPLIRRIGWEDTVQHGYLGFLEAVRTYDESKGTLASWAHLKIQAEFSRELRGLSRGMRNPPCQPVSLSEPIDESGGELIDLLPAEPPRVTPEEAMDTERLFTLVFASRLDKKDVLILYLKYMDFTLQEIGLLIGLSRERIRQRICNASRRLRGRQEIRKMLVK